MIYKGFEILETFEPWPLSYGFNYYWIDEDDRMYYNSSIENCEQEINEHIN